MIRELHELVRYRVDRADETFREAELMLQHGYLNGALNRLYYACFYAVTGLLLTEGHSSSKHSGVIALFERHWIKTGRLQVEMGRFYRRLFEQRQKGDYDDLASFPRHEVEESMEQARVFISRIKEQTDR
jgi:hypothetical protein